MKRLALIIIVSLFTLSVTGCSGRCRHRIERHTEENIKTIESEHIIIE
ncbi:MAG: hypothetical protein JEZ07_04775 [Phycisphaerae bacterium]|nr:hypothetical protein [Phycisphaerae bacterium]